MLLIMAYPLLLALAFSLLFTAAFMLRRHEGITWMSSHAMFFYVFILLALFALVVSHTDYASIMAKFTFHENYQSPIEKLLWIIFSVACGAVLFYGERLWNILFATANPQSPRKTDFSSGDFSLWFPVMSMLTVPMEEIIWRGYLPDLLQQELGLRMLSAYLLSAILFGLHHYHFGVKTIAYKIFSALLWSVLYVRSGSLLVCIAAHLTSDMLAWRLLFRIRKKSASTRLTLSL